MKKRLISIAIAVLIVLAMVPLGVFASDNADNETMYLGFGSIANFREGPGKDDTGTPVYSLNYTYAVVLFDANGRIVDVESDILELSTPNYDGASMPHFSGWPGSVGYNTFNHGTDAIDAPFAITEESAAAEVTGWKSKRERGDTYGMKEGNDWYKQMDFFEEWFRGQTSADIRTWLGKNGTSAGRPIKANTTNEADKAKYESLTDAEKAALADVLSGATMALEDPHGLIVTAVERAYDNRVEIKNGKDIVTLGLGTDKTFRVARGSYSINFTTVGAAFDSKGAIVASVFDILEIAQNSASSPMFRGWPGTEDKDGNVITVDDVKNDVDGWKTKRERGDSYGMKTAVNTGEWWEQMNYYQSWMVGQTTAQLKAWFDKSTTSAGRPIKSSTTNEGELATLAALTEVERLALADVVSNATMSLEDSHGLMLTAMLNAFADEKRIDGSFEEHADQNDAVSSASVQESAISAKLVRGLSADGTWIFSAKSDITVSGTLNVDGTFYQRNDVNGKVYRKLALYDQDTQRNVTAEYTLTVPEMVVTTPNFNIVNGKVVGNVHVSANGFVLNGAVIEGNLTFETQEQMNSAALEGGTVTGLTAVGYIDTTTRATVKESSVPSEIIKNLSADGTWIHSILSDVTLYGTLRVDGVFYSKDDINGKIYRKLALYAQDTSHNVTANYTLTVPEMIVTTPNFRIQQGTVKGDICVNARGFELVNTTIDGNIVFETQEQYESALLEKGTITGTVSVANK